MQPPESKKSVQRLSSPHDPPNLLPVKKKFTYSILSTGITPQPEDVRFLLLGRHLVVKINMTFMCPMTAG